MTAKRGNLPAEHRRDCRFTRGNWPKKRRGRVRFDSEQVATGHGWNNAHLTSCPSPHTTSSSSQGSCYYLWTASHYCGHIKSQIAKLKSRLGRPTCHIGAYIIVELIKPVLIQYFAMPRPRVPHPGLPITYYQLCLKLVVVAGVLHGRRDSTPHMGWKENSPNCHQ